MKYQLNRNMLTLCLICLAINLISCSTQDSVKELDEKITALKTEKRGSFISQILEFSSGHKGKLINKDDYSVVTYDLSDKALRKDMDRLHFTCRIGKKRYYICQGSAGICRNTGKCIEWKRKLFHKKKCVKYKYEILGVKDADYLVKSNAFCFSELYYNF